MPHDDVRVNSRPHKRKWPFKIIMEPNGRNERIHISGGISFFFWWEQYSWGSSVDSLSQYLNFECTDYIPISQPLTCFSTEKPVPPALHIQRMHSPPRSSLTVLRVHCYKFLVADLRSAMMHVHRS